MDDAGMWCKVDEGRGLRWHVGGGLRVVGFVGCCLGVGRDWRIGGEEMRRGEFARVEMCARRVYLGGGIVVIIVVCGVYGMVYKGMRISV